MVFSGKVQKLFAYKPANGWCSGVLALDDGSRIKFTGTIIGIAEGYRIQGTGDTFVDPKYGEQLKVQQATLQEPETKEGIIKALTNYDGIGPKLAADIFNEFGMDSLKIVSKSPKKLLKVPKVTENKLAKIMATEEINKGVQSVIVATDGAVSNSLAAKLIAAWGPSAAKRVKEHPYDLVNIRGIGFKTADAIAKQNGISLSDPQRIRAALVYILHEEYNKNGHVYLAPQYVQSQILRLVGDFSGIKLSTTRKQNQFEAYMTENLEEYLDNKEDIDKKFGFNDHELEFIKNWIDIAIDVIELLAAIMGNAVVDDEIHIDEAQNVYYKFDYEAEYFVASSVALLSLMKTIKSIPEENVLSAIQAVEEESGYSLGAEQKDAISTSLKSRISIITGGPGRGKTTIINTIIKVWNDDENVVLCAPTGRAAQRMKGQTGHEASTIHSLIIKATREELANKLFIVDEASMIDIGLASKLFKIIMKNNNNIIFVGDADQLPPVGAGNFFNDLIACKVLPTTFLRTGYRNFGNIASNAAKVNAGNGFSKMTLGEDFNFVECDHEALQEAVLEDYAKLLETNKPSEICILSPMRTRSSCGTDKLNELIRNKFNKNVNLPEYKDCKFVIEDRVMCTKNNKNKELTLNDEITSGVFNGDCGTVIALDLDEGYTTIEFDDGKIGQFNSSELNDFTFAYAITIHKSQGSEYNAVIITITTEHYVMLQRNLLYTAITRAKNRVDMFGMKKAFNMAVRNTDYKLRNSKLRVSIITNVKMLSSLSPQDLEKTRRERFSRFIQIELQKSGMAYYKEED